MPSRTVIIAGVVGLVGAATAGGYYIAKMQTPQPVVQTPPVQQQVASQPQQQPAPIQSTNANPPEQQYAPPQQYAAPRQYAAPAPYEPRRRQEYRRDFDQYHRVSFGYFHDELEPYGDWRYSDRWGEVWRPRDNDYGFRPYTHGHWANTREYGWTWVSDEPWGGIAYHYGRWVDDPDQGWIWIPGYVWGPGWVSWRSGGGYTGWRPMPPDREFLQNGENHRDHWSGSDADSGYHQWYGYDQDRLDSQWTFVDTGHFADRDYRGHEYSRPEDTRRMMPQTGVNPWSETQKMGTVLDEENGCPNGSSNPTAELSSWRR